jgi:transcriptional regulator with XRE-family HTH domain
VLSKDEQNNFYKKLGELIKNARKRAGLNQDDVAKYLDLTRISIVNIEKGNQKVQLHSLLEIAKLLEIDVAELLSPLYVVVDKSVNVRAEKAINKQLGQLDDKEIGSEILKGFMKYTKYKK